MSTINVVLTFQRLTKANMKVNVYDMVIKLKMYQQLRSSQATFANNNVISANVLGVPYC